MPLPRSLSFAHLRNKHPEYDAVYWRECRALLAGGKRLLCDRDVLERLFPRHPHEEPDVYDERKKRALYVPFPGEIVGDLVGMLAQDPPMPSAEPEPDPFYSDTLFEDMDRKGMTLGAYVQAMVREALTVRTAWALVDLPRVEAEVEPVSLADEEAAGALRAWACPIPAESVTDWEEDDEGELLWACVHHCHRRRTSPGDDRTKVTDVWTFYDEHEWVQFEATYDPEKPPKDDEVFHCAASDLHTFGEVPLVRLELPEGLWCLDKLHSTARAHFNQRSALSYSQNKGLFPVLAAFLGPEMAGGGTIPADAQQSPTRATDQTYGIGRVVVFGKDDDLRYVSPDAAVYVFAGQDLDKLRDEMHRVTATMASSIDATPAAVGRSGESKAQDKSDRELVLQHLGVIALDHVRDLLVLIAKGRKDPDYTWTVSGLRRFSDLSTSDALEQATVLGGLKLPSKTFHTIYRKKLAQRLVAHDASDHELDAIAQEIEKNTTDEEFDPMPPMPPDLGAFGPPGNALVKPPGRPPGGGAGGRTGVPPRPRPGARKTPPGAARSKSAPKPSKKR